MTQLKIHWWNMTFHKRVAISVTLTSWTGGTVVFTPAALWPVYSLNRLPIGTQIQLVQIQWVDTYMFLHNGSEIWSLTITASSWYNFNSVAVNGTTVTSTPITLLDGDIITANFVPITKPINFYLWWVGQSYWDPWDFVIINYNWKQLNPNVSYIEMQNDRDEVQLDISSTGEESSFKFYFSWGSGSDWLLAYIATSNYKIAQIEYYDADTGTTYICDWTSPVIWNVWDGWMARILLDTGQTCDLVDYQTAWWSTPTYKSSDIRNALQQFVGQFWQFQDFQVAAPNNLSYEYILYDWDRSCCWLAYWDLKYVYYDQEHWRQPYNVNTSVIVAFFDAGSDLYATPYELHPSWQYQFLPQWSNTSLPDPTGYIYQVFTYWDKNTLLHWMQDWRCWNVCDLIPTIYNLATNK